MAKNIKTDRQIKKAYKQGYRSIGTARRFVWRHFLGLGYKFDGPLAMPRPRELVPLFEEHFGIEFDPEYWNIRDRLIWAAELLIGVPHIDPEENKWVNKRKAEAYQRKSKEFIESPEWYAIRQLVLNKHGRKCMRCGITAEHAVITVDHIKSRRNHPRLALNPDNLQVLCRACNSAKGKDDDRDYRQEASINDL